MCSFLLTHADWEYERRGASRESVSVFAQLTSAEREFLGLNARRVLVQKVAEVGRELAGCR